MSTAVQAPVAAPAGPISPQFSTEIAAISAELSNLATIFSSFLASSTNAASTAVADNSAAGGGSSANNASPNTGTNSLPSSLGSYLAPSTLTSLLTDLQALASSAASQLTPGAATGTADASQSAAITAQGSPVVTAGTSVTPPAAPQPEAPTTANAGSATTAASVAPGTAHLLPAATEPSSQKPTLGAFMAASGADASTASEILYGSIGSNSDLRDWAAIMSSSTPLADAKASTAALYNSNLGFISPQAQKPTDVIASTQNFALIGTTALNGLKGDATSPPELVLTDGQGNILRAESNPQSLVADATNFGFDLSQLSALEAQLVAAGVNYQQGAWVNGFLGAQTA